MFLTAVLSYRRELPFIKTAHLSNPWNEHKPVKIGRDGQVGDALLLLFDFSLCVFPHCQRALLSRHAPSGDPAGHRRSALRPLPAGRERGHPPGRPPHSTQASDTDRSAAPGSAAAARTGKVSQSPSTSCFLFFFSCGDHGTPCCRTFRRRLSQNPRRPFLVFWLCSYFFYFFRPQRGITPSDAMFDLPLKSGEGKKVTGQEFKFFLRSLSPSTSSCQRGRDESCLKLSYIISF